MNNQTLEKVVKKYLLWDQQNRNAKHFERHEALKSLLFTEGLINDFSTTVEKNVEIQGYKRRYDYSDSEMVIEIDDGPHRRSIEKLCFARDVEKKKPLWILLLTQGKGGKARRVAKNYNLPILRIFVGHRSSDTSFEWI